MPMLIKSGIASRSLIDDVFFETIFRSDNE